MCILSQLPGGAVLDTGTRLMDMATIVTVITATASMGTATTDMEERTATDQVLEEDMVLDSREILTGSR